MARDRLRESRIAKHYMQAYWRWTRGLTMGAQGVVMRDDGAVLLVRHGYRPGWHFPGGGVEKNETALTAMHRELHEEAGVEVDGPAELHGLFANFRYFRSDHIALFVVRHWRQPIVPEPNREIAELGFFARDALPEGTVAAVPRRLAEIFDGVAVSPEW